MATGALPAASLSRRAQRDPPPDAQTTPAAASKHAHSKSSEQPSAPSLLRKRSSSSASTSRTSRNSRRASNPARTPTTQASTTTPATTPSYYSPQHYAFNPKDVRSPTARRPPASFSSFGKAYGDTSLGPPISASGTWPKEDLSPRALQQPSTDRMAGSSEASSGYDSGARPRLRGGRTADSRHGDTDTSGAEGDGGEDLFLNIAEDSAKDSAASRLDRVRQSRLGRSNRQSAPSPVPSLPQTTTNFSRPNGTRMPAAIDTQASTQYRRSSLVPFSTRAAREQSPLTQAPLTPANHIATSQRIHDISPKNHQDRNQEHHDSAALPDMTKASPFSPKDFRSQVEALNRQKRDSTLSPTEFLAELDAGRRRSSLPDAFQTPPNRNGIYKPSNLHYYSSSRDNPATPHVDTPPEAQSRYGATSESHGSTGPATSMWDELDELKTRMKRLEMGGKIPATSGAAVAQASGNRPQTANTSATTVSSSPNQQKKPALLETPALASTPTKMYPLLHEALAKVRPHVAPSVYRTLEATATEALGLAEMTGNGGPQGTFHSTSSILAGGHLPDRHVRRKADHICRALTELCVELYNNKPSLLSPAVQRSSAAAVARRPSLQINGESPHIRQSIEPESDTLEPPRSSPSRAMSRIEARRSSLMARREGSQEPPTPSQPLASTRLDRSTTSLYRRSTVEPDEDDPTLRAPSRAMTDFRETRPVNKSRFSREYTSREPMPDLQGSALPTPASRRTTFAGTGNENDLLYRSDSTRRYGVNSQSSPAYDKRPLESTPRTTQFASNRNSIGGITSSRVPAGTSASNPNRNSIGSFPLGRTASLSRRRVNGE